MLKGLIAIMRSALNIWFAVCITRIYFKVTRLPFDYL